MEEPKRNPMKKVSWLIVAMAVLSAVYVHLPKGMLPELDHVISRLHKDGPGTPAEHTDDPKPSADTAAPSPSTANSATGNTPAVADPTPAPLNNTAGGPKDVTDESGAVSASGNHISPLRMEAAVLMMNADHDGWKSGCKPGVLLLDGSGLHFTCTANPGKNVDVLLADIASIDKSGIKDSKGHPDHFKIQHAEKEEQGERIFRDWLQQARLSSQPIQTAIMPPLQ